MKTKNVGGGHPPPSSSTRSTSTSAPKPSTPAPATPKTTPPAPAKTGGDGFAKAGASSSGSHVPTTQTSQATQPKAPSGKNVTAEFGKDPKQFAQGHMLNAYNAKPPHGLPLPTPSATFVPASQSTVSVNVHQGKNGNAQMSFGPAGGPGHQAHYLHYLSEGEGRFAGISGVPKHPTANAPTTIVTGPLNGCAVHAFHDPKTDTMSFVHHANYSKNGKAELAEFQQQHPHLKHAATLEPKDYSHRIFPDDKHKRDETGSTAMLQYNKPSAQGLPGHWSIVSQMNEYSMKDGEIHLKPPFQGGNDSRKTQSNVQEIPIFT